MPSVTSPGDRTTSVVVVVPVKVIGLLAQPLLGLNVSVDGADTVEEQEASTQALIVTLSELQVSACAA